MLSSNFVAILLIMIYSGGIKKGEGSLISQIKSMAAKVQQGMEGISSFSLPELTLPHFDGSGWNDDKPAQTVADKINGMIHEDDSVFK